MPTSSPSVAGARAGRWLVAILLGLAAVSTTTAVAHAQDASDDGLALTIRSAPQPEDGRIRMLVDVANVPSDGLPPDAFAVTEDDQPVDELEATLASESADAQPRQVMLAIDTSDSTAGAPRRSAIAAARAFSHTVTAEDVEVGLVPFALAAQISVEPTDDPGLVSTALDEMPGGNETHLYDAVVAAAEVLAELEGQHDIVVFSDGADIGSSATLMEAIAAAQDAKASVTSVALETEQLLERNGLAALDRLAEETGGEVIRVGNVGGLGNAFAGLAETMTNQYVLTWESDLEGRVDVEVTVAAGTVSATETVPAFLPPAPDPAGRTDPVVAVTAPGMFGNEWVAGLAATMAFVAVALLGLAVAVPIRDRRVVRNLEAAVGAGTVEAPRDQDLSTPTAAMSRRAIQLIERMPKPEGYDQAMQLRIDRASWPLRSSELTTLRALAALTGLGLGWALLGGPLFGLLLGAVGWVVPNAVLGARVAARQRRFMEQLPDTLQLLAGSLKAGYGVLQAIDTVVKETGDPTRSEFQRVLSEARLGLPLDESLTDMADRVGAEDFRWVAVSITIQRRVGGNLAQLLETVAATLRERAATQRQISALSAEGRLSAVILTLMPFGIGLYMVLVNPGYLSPLFTTGVGQSMLVGAGVLMVVGVLWMRNLIRIDT